MNGSVVIPVYNGAKTISPLVERLEKVLPKLFDVYEVVLVCDGSPDNSWEIITGLAEKYPWVRGIELMRNYGQDNAVLCGIREARYEIIVTMDDDLQHPPEEIPVLVNKLDDGYDVVYGIPKKMPHSWWRNIASVITKRVVSTVMGTDTVRYISSFRAIRAHLRDAFPGYQVADVQVDVLFTWGTNRFTYAEVDEVPRAIGSSNYNLYRLVRMALLVLTSYTTIPLRFASILGFLFTIFGAVILVYVLVIYFTEASIPGFPFLASTITIFSGVQLFALGIIGEYLARVFERTTGRHTYTIFQRTGKP